MQALSGPNIVIILNEGAVWHPPHEAKVVAQLTKVIDSVHFLLAKLHPIPQLGGGGYAVGVTRLRNLVTSQDWPGIEIVAFRPVGALVAV